MKFYTNLICKAVFFKQFFENFVHFLQSSTSIFFKVQRIFKVNGAPQIAMISNHLILKNCTSQHYWSILCIVIFGNKMLVKILPIESTTCFKIKSIRHCAHLCHWTLCRNIWIIIIFYLSDSLWKVESFPRHYWERSQLSFIIEIAEFACFEN